MLPLPYDTHPNPRLIHLIPAILRTISTELLFNYLSSPLDMLRTRMVVQSSASPQYKGPFRGLIQICRSERVFTGVIAKQTIIASLVKSFMRHGKNVVIDLLFNGWYWGTLAFDLVWDLAEMCTMVPLEAMLRRAYLQTWSYSDTIIPIDKTTIHLNGNKKMKELNLWRGLKVRLLMIIFHKISSGLIINMDIDEEY